MRIGCMVWRVDGVLDFYEQIARIQADGFTAVEFWTLPGQPGVWQGFDVLNASPEDVDRLRHALAAFGEVDVHAGVDLSGARSTHMAATCKLAAEVGASVVTVHPAPGLDEPDEIEALRHIDALAAQYGLLVGIEPMGGAESARRVRLLERLCLPNVGLTVDVGHLYFEAGAAFVDYRTLGGLVRQAGARVVHVHAHDYDGRDDHLAVGRGLVDWADLIGALCDVGFAGSLCLELNPFREPERARESRDRLRAMVGAHRTRLCSEGNARSPTGE